MTIVRQRAEKDCAIGALGSYLRLPYETVEAAAAKVDRRDRGTKGLFNTEVIAIAKRLKLRLRVTYRFDLSRHNGILRVYFDGERAERCPGGHFVAIEHGVIGCSADGAALPWEAWLKANCATAWALLKEIA